MERRRAALREKARREEEERLREEEELEKALAEGNFDPYAVQEEEPYRMGSDNWSDVSGTKENEFGLEPFLVVLSVQPNSPGMRAGFFPFDEVMAVGELTSLGLSSSEAF